MSVGAQLTLTGDRTQVEAGARAVLTAWITNSGTQAEEFSLRPRGIEPAWLTFRPPTVTVPPGQQLTSTIVVNPPADAFSADLFVTITLVARSTGAVVGEASVPLRLLGAAAPVTPTQPTRTPTKSGGRGAWIAAGAAGFVLVAALATVLILHHRGGGGSPAPAQPMGTACTDQPTKVATLFSDNSLTAIRLSDEDTTNLQVLHTEQARILPPLYEPLLSLSSDGSRLAYVTASNESMDDAHLEYLDVANPNQATELASIPQGFWNVRPAWSPDNKQLAFLRLNTQSAAQGKTVLELWVAEVGGQAHKVNIPNDLLRPDDFTANPALPLCWAADNKTVIFTNVARESKATDQGTRLTGSSASGTQASGAKATDTPAAALAPDSGAGASASPQQIEVDVTTGARRDAARPDQPLPAAADVAPAPPVQPKGANCTLVAYSQNDPRWSSQVMRAGGDRIGPFGCALTSATMVLNYYGADTNPGVMNACLGAYAEDIYWSQAVGCVNGKVTGANALDFSWSNLDQILAKGQPAIVGLLGGQAGSHFVVVTSGGGGDASNYTITDPWDASTNHTLGTLISRGYNPRWIRTYDGTNQGCVRVISGAAPPDDPNGISVNNSGRPLAPAQLMDFFTRAANQTGVPREYLLAIASIESNFTPRAQGPLIPQFANNEDAHALGMMQFLPSTYRGLIPRVDQATGKNLGADGIYDPESAIFAGAFYLRDAGAPGNMHDAIFAYNRAEWYVDEVVALAKKYAGGAILDDNIYDPNGSNKPGTRSNPNPTPSPTGTTTGTPAPTPTSTTAPTKAPTATSIVRTTTTVTATTRTSTSTTAPTATRPGTVGTLKTVTPRPTASRTAKSPTPKGGGKTAPKPIFVWSVADGSIHQDAVRLDLSWFGDIGDVVSASVLNLTLNNVKPGPVPSQDFTQGMTLTDEGIYQIVIVTRQDDQLHVTRRKFTIDHTAPLLNVTLSNGVQASAAPAAIPLGLSLAPRTVAATDPKPASRGPASLDIRYADTLSGVATIEYQLDGSEWKLAFNDAMFSGAMTIAAPGDHLVSMRATDLAGNISAVRTFDFTVLPATGTPTPATPVPTRAPTTPTAPVATLAATPASSPSAAPSPSVAPDASVTPVPTEQPAPGATPAPAPTRPPAPTAAPNAPVPPTDVPASATVVPTPTLIPTASNAPATLVLPPDQTVTVNAPSGATVPFDVSARDNAGNAAPVVCDAKSGALFPVGTTVVTCTATTTAGLKTQASFRITVKLGPPPTISPQDNLAVEGNTKGGATVTFNVTAQDAVDGPLPVSCTPSSGALFKLGTTNVTCTATNSFGQQATRRFTVTVSDTTPPALALPANISVIGNYNTDFLGATVSYTVSATDIVDGSVPVGCSPASGSFFKGGTTAVNCTARDAAGNVATGSFNVTVRPPPDTQPPVITTQGNIARDSNSPIAVTYQVSATDNVDGTVAVSCSPPSGTTFNVDTTTTVTCTAHDAAGNAAVPKTFTVKISSYIVVR